MLEDKVTTQLLLQHKKVNVRALNAHIGPRQQIERHAGIFQRGTSQFVFLVRLIKNVAGATEDAEILGGERTVESCHRKALATGLGGAVHQDDLRSVEPSHCRVRRFVNLRNDVVDGERAIKIHLEGCPIATRHAEVGEVRARDDADAVAII